MSPLLGKIVTNYPLSHTYGPHRLQHTEIWQVSSYLTIQTVELSARRQMARVGLDAGHRSVWNEHSDRGEQAFFDAKPTAWMMPEVSTGLGLGVVCGNEAADSFRHPTKIVGGVTLKAPKSTTVDDGDKGEERKEGVESGFQTRKIMSTSTC